jgi:hypothetical protein
VTVTRVRSYADIGPMNRALYAMALAVLHSERAGPPRGLNSAATCSSRGPGGSPWRACKRDTARRRDQPGARSHLKQVRSTICWSWAGKSRSRVRQGGRHPAAPASARSARPGAWPRRHRWSGPATARDTGDTPDSGQPARKDFVVRDLASCDCSSECRTSMPVRRGAVDRHVKTA